MVNIYVARHGQDEDNAAGILNGRRDEPLTDLGRQQARDVAENMLKAGFTASSYSSTTYAAAPSASSALSSSSSKIIRLSSIYSSPLRRAHETAEIFAGILSSGRAGDDGDAANGSSPSRTPDSGGENIEIQVLDDLVERDFGIMTGRPATSILEACGADRVLAAGRINYFLDPDGAETFPDLISRATRLLSHIDRLHSSSSPASSILLVTHGDFGKMLYAAYYGLRWEDALQQFHFGNSEVLLLAKNHPHEKAHVFETTQFNA